ncbi:sterol desaturase family protein [Filimonas lacunae]|uniref:sterol desaturase family protein n=1 Tax=Filimonas lacunae TaxID=477680 RepID=UPI001E3AF594|nr:sterol desaturase family protein [Filimonas lacunae]
MRNYISNSRESVRMFSNNLLEALSKVHYSVPLFVYIPVIATTAYLSYTQSNLAVIIQVILALSGLACWTFTEYILHRFVFHFVPKSKAGQRLHFIMHGVHHDYPNDAKRLVMPPSVSIPLALLFYSLFYLVLPSGSNNAFFTGFITGYLVYDMTHYILHHYNFKSRLGKALKKHHMIHHYANPDKAFGVSSTIWDKVFHSDK